MKKEGRAKREAQSVKYLLCMKIKEFKSLTPTRKVMYGPVPALGHW